MSDGGPGELRIRGQTVDLVVAALGGDLSSAIASTVQVSLTKLLIKHSRVLLDISPVQLSWAPAPELFVTAIAAAGGWPSAQLVLIGADQPTTDRLRACRVAEFVSLAATEQEAAALVTRRPTRLMRSEQFPAHPTSVARAGVFAADLCRQWEVPDVADRAAVIVGGLAADAVGQGHHGFRLRLVLEPGRLRVSVRDHCPSAGPPFRSTERVEALGAPWGVLHYDDGRAVWAVLDTAEPAAAAPPRPAVGPTPRHPRARSAATTAARERPRRPLPTSPTTPVVRRHFVSYDVEQAHEFISSTYCRHSPRLTGAPENLQLEFSATATSSFSLERFSHSMAIQADFEPSSELFVAHLVGGRWEIGSRGASYRTAPGGLLLVGPDTEYEVGWNALDVELIRLDPAAVADVAGDVCDIDPTSLRFDLTQPVSQPRALHWLSLIQTLRHGVLDNDDVLSSPLVRAATFRHLTATLLETFPNPALDVLVRSARSARAGSADRRPPSGPVHRRARRRGHRAGRHRAGGARRAACPAGGVPPLSRRDPAGAAAPSTSGASPSRSRHGRSDRWRHGGRDRHPVGFAHHGYFAASYRRAYGRSPQVTLRS